MTPDLNRAARMAYKTLLALHIESLPVDPLMILSFCKNTRVRTYDEIASRFGISDPAHLKWYYLDNKDAYTVRQEKNGKTLFELIYDSHANPARQRFTLAHELGHIVLKHQKEEWWEEKEADQYAAQLLAPRPLFDLLTRYRLNPSDPELIGRVFGLSNAAAQIAVQPQRVLPDPALYARLQTAFASYIELLSFTESA